MSARVVTLLVGVAVAAALSGCALLRPTTVPMRTIAVGAECASRPDTLLVFLPGSYSLPEDYLREGYLQALHERHIAADVLLVDAHLGYYSERSVIERLHADVIVPAQVAGYRHIWLVGISIGAFGALIHAIAPPAGTEAGVEAIVMLAPYLGDRRVSVSVEASGGLAHWPAPAHPLPPNEDDQRVWQWLQGYTRGDPRPQLFLGYGQSDRFALSDRLLAAALPPAHVVALPGGHDWPTWNALWQRLLPSLPLPADASCGTKTPRD